MGRPAAPQHSTAARPFNVQRVCVPKMNRICSFAYGYLNLIGRSLCNLNTILKGNFLQYYQSIN